MSPDRFAEIEKGGWVRYHDRALFSVSGKDRVRYLNGQLTNQVTRAEAETVYACVLDLKGRLQGELFLHAANGLHVLDAPRSLREALPARLDRYLVADDVVIEPADSDYLLFHCYGAESAAPATTLGLEPRPADRLGQSGHDFLIPRTEVDAWLEAHFAEGAPHFLDDDEAELLAILAGRPAWGAGLVEGRLLPEAGIEDRAVDYHKGCYLGQEVISRIKSAGKVNHRLRSLIASQPPKPGEVPPEFDGGALFAADEAGEAASPVGEIATAALHPSLDRLVALAYVKSSVGEDMDLVFRSETEDKLPVLFRTKSFQP